MRATDGEVGDWTSSRLVSEIYAILVSDVLGYHWVQKHTGDLAAPSDAGSDPQQKSVQLSVWAFKFPPACSTEFVKVGLMRASTPRSKFLRSLLASFASTHLGQALHPCSYPSPSVDAERQFSWGLAIL